MGKDYSEVVAWTLVGVLAGAAIGIAGPLGMTLLFVVAEGEQGWQAGTAFAILATITFPAGAVLGGVFGWRRGSTGTWENVFSSPPPKTRHHTIASDSDTAPNKRRDSTVFSPTVVLIRKFRDFESELDSLEEQEANSRKLAYVEQLNDLRDKLFLDKSELMATTLVGLVIPVVLLAPVCLVARYYITKMLLDNHINAVSRKWYIESKQPS